MFHPRHHIIKILRPTWLSQHTIRFNHLYLFQKERGENWLTVDIL